MPRLDKGGPQRDADFLYVDISSIDNRTKKIQDPKVLPANEAPSRARQRLEPFDVLVSMTRPNLNAVALLPESMSGAIGSTGFHVLRAVEVEPRWLFYLVQSPDFVDAMSFLVQGALYPAVRSADVAGYEIPLAPLPEQRRIVEEIEKQFTRLDAAVESLERARANLKRYRASVLAAACEGRLVPTEPELARQEGHDYEPATALLDRILTERRARWEADELAKLHAKGKPPKNDAWKSRYKAPTSPDTTDLPELPEGWVWATVEQLASPKPRSVQSGPFGSSLLHSEFQDAGILAIGIDNVQEGKFSSGSEHRISEQKFNELRKYQARPLDVLITVMATVGRCCVVPANNEKAIITKHVYRITSDLSLVNPSYLMFSLWGGEEVRKQMFGNVRGQTRPGINGSILRQLSIPLPPLTEQQRIVAEVERRLSVVEEMERTVEADLQRAGRLRQAILKRAFEGRLVPQDPTDEPASALLEQIRAEREQAKPAFRSRRSSKTHKSQPAMQPLFDPEDR